MIHRCLFSIGEVYQVFFIFYFLFFIFSFFFFFFFVKIYQLNIFPFFLKKKSTKLEPFEISPRLLLCIQTLIASKSVDPKEPSENDIEYPPSIRAQGLVTLGKISLQNEEFAKQHVVAIAQELETSQDAVVRNNAMMILCDLCIKYFITFSFFLF